MPISCYRLLDDPRGPNPMGLVALKNVEHPMELMLIRVDDASVSGRDTPGQDPGRRRCRRCDNEGVTPAASRTFDTVIFDFYGTLGHATQWLSLDAVLADHGYELPDDVRQRWWFESEHDGLEHREHSHSEDTYAQWQRNRMLGMLAECDVHPGEYEVITTSSAGKARACARAIRNGRVLRRCARLQLRSARTGTGISPRPSPRSGWTPPISPRLVGVGRPVSPTR